MFKKILIANRGEIACRVIKTARKMGIKTVAVYSEADAAALHVDMADEAVAIGPAASAQSYLSIEKIVDACQKTNAEAVHPGYGFLSERTAFAEALSKAKIAFIGPNAHAIAAMGDKIESKKLAAKAKVSCVPGYIGEVKELKEAARIAGEIGYPVMVKASAGGGGKGLRIVFAEADLAQAILSSQHEAKASFGDDRLFIEKYITDPRHIEIQVLGDKHGNVIHLGERECSIQRRHQKVIEEAPSPFLDVKTRAAMGAQAVALAEAVGYASAGTVEFIVDIKKHFYFLEMNTRLQVEHPVTEMVTGLDLVEQMIRVAAGEKLKIKQKDVALNGWAIEARVYAEEPERGFLPSIGRLVKYREPATGGAVRVDSGVYEGAEISMFYDPMIAKVVGYGADRQEATVALRDALDSFHIRGVGHNINFLTALLKKPRFASGKLSTNFIAEEFPDGFGGTKPEIADIRLINAVAAVVHHQYDQRDAAISGRLRPAPERAGGQWVIANNGERHMVTVAETAGGYAVIDDEASIELASTWRLGEPLFQATANGRQVTVQVERIGTGYRVSHGGVLAKLRVLPTRAAELLAKMPVKRPPDMSRFLLSPMPGLLVSLAVETGQEVKAGQELAIVEAMKMENLLRAERDGRVAKLHAKPGDSLAVDQPIVEFA